MASVEQLSSWHPVFMPNSITELDLNDRKLHTRSPAISPNTQIPAGISDLGPLQALSSIEDTGIYSNDGDDTAMSTTSDPKSDLDNPQKCPPKSLADPENIETNGYLTTGGLSDSRSPPEERTPSRELTYGSGHTVVVSPAKTAARDIDWGDDGMVLELDSQTTETKPCEYMASPDHTNPLSRPPSQLLDHHTQGYDSFHEAKGEKHSTGAFRISKDPFAEDSEDLYSKDDIFTSSMRNGGTIEDSLGDGGVKVMHNEDCSMLELRGQCDSVPSVTNSEAERAPSYQAQSSTLPSNENPEGSEFFSGVQDSDNGEGFYESTKSNFLDISSTQVEPYDGPKSIIHGTEDAIDTQAPLNNVVNGSITNSTTDYRHFSAKAEPFPISDADVVLNEEPNEEDLAARWKEAFVGDELFDDGELLPDDHDVAVDPGAFFGSDDEGFLEDDSVSNPIASVEQISPSTAALVVNDENNNAFNLTENSPNNVSRSRYLPSNTIPAAIHQSSSYISTMPHHTNSSSQIPAPQGHTSPITISSLHSYGTQEQTPRPELPKAQSFAAQPKGGYTSPYDLPMDIVTPRKRGGMQMAHKYSNSFASNSAPPPRSISMPTQGLPSRESPPTMPPPPPVIESSQNPQNPSAGPVPQKIPTTKPPTPALKPNESFFEELPVSSKPKRTGRYTPQINSTPPTLQENSVIPRAHSPVTSYSGLNVPQSGQGLVSPPKVGPYAPIQTSQPQQPTPTSRYSPASVRSGSGHSPPPSGRYISTPSRQPLSSIPPHPSVPTPVLPYQPRTSSPLAHFEIPQDSKLHTATSLVSGNTGAHQRGNLGFDHVSRAPSLPVTQEVDESNADISNLNMESGPNTQDGSTSYPQRRHASQSSQQPSQAPQTISSRGRSSPPKSSNYILRRAGNSTQDQVFVPRRSQTQSPPKAVVDSYLDLGSSEPYKRPMSVHGPAATLSQNLESLPSVAPIMRPRDSSQALNYITPSDGRQSDPLQRWKGGPIFAWGVGGTIVTSFPKEIPRYGLSQSSPMIICSPGEIRVRNMKDLNLLEEKLANFPGPLKNKSKKKEVLAWLSAGIGMLEQQTDYLQPLPSLAHEDKRREERLLLWKILRIVVENDGVVEGNAAINKAVLSILYPGVEDENSLDSQHISGSLAQSEPIDLTTINQLRMHLLRGEREKAIWKAVDKRLWAHAMLISSTLSSDLYKRVVQEFVQKEVKGIGGNTESLATLYEIFAENFEESVDELVPPSARAGFQMISTSTVSGPSKNSLDGLDRWRETLGLILSNRSPGDNQAINALGKLLSGYGRVEAAHICFIFARSHSIFGGVDDPLSNVVLVGSDHLQQPLEFDKELESILLSEIYEYGLSLSSTSNTGFSAPHLVIYKVHHATVLAEIGQRDRALQYCDTILSSINSQTRRSPYHHALLLSVVEDLTKRLKQSPKDESISWITRPSIDKVSNSVWTKFNKFVAGDENELAAAGSGSENGSDIGPFAKIAGGTPAISRSPSTGDLYGVYNAGLNFNTSDVKTSTRYSPNAPAIVQDQSASQLGQTYPGVLPGPLFEEMSTSRDSHNLDSRSNEEYFRTETGAQNSGPTYNPSNPITSSFGQAIDNKTHPRASSHYKQTDDGFESHSIAHDSPPITYYEPSSNNYVPPNNYEPPSNNYEPPSNNYEPPSNNYEAPSSNSEPPSNDYYEPSPSSRYDPPSSSGYAPPSDELEIGSDDRNLTVDTNPEEKGSVDNDPPLKTTNEKTRAEKDKETDEAFRKAAEADAKKDSNPAPRKGWGLGSWFSKKDVTADAAQPKKPTRANLGENSNFYYDAELKRWVNKKATKDDTSEQSVGTPPPPRAGPPRAVSGPLNPFMTPNLKPSIPPQRAASAALVSPPALQSDGTVLTTPPSMSRSFSNGSAGRPPSRPPSRPATSMSNASSIDELLGPPVARKGVIKKPRRGREYIDVMGEKTSS